VPRHGDDHYRTLGVSMAASDEQVRAAYRVLARRLHPDLAEGPANRRQAEAAMASVNEAWRILGDSHRRSAYDLARRPPGPVARPSPADEEFHGRRGDSFQAIRVPRAVGCLLQFGPVALIVGLLVGILVVTAFMGGGTGVAPRLAPGSCVALSSTIRVVPCTVETPVIVARGVAGTPCPLGSVTLVLPTLIEQVCVAPPGTPVG
jgi:hypothetical protein